jgi:hypothetical protein
MTKTTQEEIQYWDKILDDYEKTLSLPEYGSGCSVPEAEINNYLSMSRNEIEKLNPEDCAQIAYRLSQFGFYLQRSLNREIARHNWAEESIKETIADEINNYKGYGFLEKSLQAIKHNDKASGLNKIKKYAQQRMDRLSYLANNIKNLSDILLSIQRTKVKHAS